MRWLFVTLWESGLILIHIFLHQSAEKRYVIFFVLNTLLMSVRRTMVETSQHPKMRKYHEKCTHSQQYTCMFEKCICSFGSSTNCAMCHGNNSHSPQQIVRHVDINKIAKKGLQKCNKCLWGLKEAAAFQKDIGNWHVSLSIHEGDCNLLV